MSQKTLVFFTSDVHLGLEVSDAAAREERFVAFLRSIPVEKTQALYLLGDIWDFWYEYKHVVPKGYFKVFTALSGLIEAGVDVYFMPGNHDIWTYHYLQSLGIKVVKERVLFTEHSGKVFCLSHGDGLGRGMWGYKTMRAIFHCRFFQILFSTLHPRIAFGIGRTWSRHNRLAKKQKYQFRGEAEPLYGWASKITESRKTDYLICGHFHCSYRAVLPSGTEFSILDSWMDGAPYLCFSPKSGLSGSLPNME